MWLENLNLRGDYKERILKYIKTKYPNLIPLYEDIYNNGDRTYWKVLNNDLKVFVKKENMFYVRDDDSKWADFGKLPVVVNYFYTVGDNIREYYDMLKKDVTKNIILEWNEGNHFMNSDLRTAKGFGWIIN